MDERQIASQVGRCANFLVGLMGLGGTNGANVSGLPNSEGLSSASQECHTFPSGI